jgi:hypothetical protein
MNLTSHHAPIATTSPTTMMSSIVGESPKNFSTPPSPVEPCASNRTISIVRTMCLS